MSDSGSLYLHALSNMSTKSETMSSTVWYCRAVILCSTFCMSIGRRIIS